MPSARTGQLVDYCSHFKLSGFVMVEHRHAGSWLGKLCFPLEVQWVFLEVHCPMALSGFGMRVPDRESSGNPVASLGGCWCDLSGSPMSLLFLLQPWPAPLPIGFFLERAVRGDRSLSAFPPCGLFFFLI